MKNISFGNICKTKYWLSFEWKPFAYWRWWLSFQPTYNGTTKGLHIGTPWFTILGHKRHPLINKEL